MTEHEELLGADFFEHDIRHPGVGVSRAISVLKHYDDGIDCTIAPDTTNKGYIHCRKIINIYKKEDILSYIFSYTLCLLLF